MASDTEEQQVVPKSKWPEFLRPKRSWFWGAAGVVAAYIIARLDAPIWLALAVLVLLLVAGGNSTQNQPVSLPVHHLGISSPQSNAANVKLGTTEIRKLVP